MASEQQPSLRNLTTKIYGKLSRKQHKPLQEIVKPHIDSFNYMYDYGLDKSIKEIDPLEWELHNKQRVKLYPLGCTIELPSYLNSNNIKNNKIYPSHCRMAGKSYNCTISVHFVWEVDGISHGPEEVPLGEFPTMIKSKACNLYNMSPKELVSKGEDAEELGGYFIISGNEKFIRMLTMPRRNYPLAISRSSYKQKGKFYSTYAIYIRCVKSDESLSDLTLHYLTNGTVVLSIIYNKEHFFIPVMYILKSLIDKPDQWIFKQLTNNEDDTAYYKRCIANMMRSVMDEKLFCQDDFLSYLGSKFRVKFNRLPEWKTNLEFGKYLIEKTVLVHLNCFKDKFNLLAYMIRKIFRFAKKECAEESTDNPMFQEVLLPGQMYQRFLQEKVENWMTIFKYTSLKLLKKDEKSTLGLSIFNNAVKKSGSITSHVEYLFATGNLRSTTNIGLLQTSGLVLMADRINFYRWLSHFQSVHRGAFFTEMRTTGVRKLLPEAWGFICPVHTPDGAPCGLLNHLSANCQILCRPLNDDSIPLMLSSFGMIGINDVIKPLGNYYTVILNGKVVGYFKDDIIVDAVSELRHLKVHGEDSIPENLEICFVKKTDISSQYPGLYLFTTLARMLRPVKNLIENKTELIGTFEQAYLDICVNAEDYMDNLTTHMELTDTSIFSTLASLTPFSDNNQSPRNMYQCQMAKQTMATPLHAIDYRSDNKLYKLQSPQSPLVRPNAHDYYKMDDYPMGTNAIVAVISYTGYDMEDAMILSKSSEQRGFSHATVFKTEIISLVKKKRGERGLEETVSFFGTIPNDPQIEGKSFKLEADGFPPIGSLLKEQDPYYSFVNMNTGKLTVKRYLKNEQAYIHRIKAISMGAKSDGLHTVAVTLRFERNPTIGDKFSSRHGQKGICSQKWPIEDMPFTESGITPDILFNPHGFPSRMTIGMLIESIAGKSACMHGNAHDATSFMFNEEETAYDYFGRHLTAAGYNYYGTERMYNGINGEEIEADIFIGNIYYQRLRHMVADKFQVRTTGPVDSVTLQPIKGRSRMGGIRFGEMERDALISHGASSLLQDRLMNCSDKAKARVCTQCGDILSLFFNANSTSLANNDDDLEWKCRLCNTEKFVRTLKIPYILKVFVTELASMNIRLKFECNN